MIKKRNKVFETNSSSVHTVTIAPSEKREQPDYNGCPCELEFLEFGWSGDCSTWSAKLAYIAQIAFECIPWKEKEKRGASMWYPHDAQHVGHAIDMIKEDPTCKHIEDIVCKWINASEIVWNGSGYIDHQSYEGYDSLDDWLKDHGLDSDDKILDFIFGDSYIEISNDNGDW